MTDRRRVIVLLVCLALVVGLLSWRTLGTLHLHCFFASTDGNTGKTVDIEVPCDATPKQLEQILGIPHAR